MLTGWLFAAFLLAGRGDAPLDDITPISPGRRRLGFALYLVALSILMPLPGALWPAAGLG
jgi:hypothetical protein